MAAPRTIRASATPCVCEKVRDWSFRYSALPETTEDLQGMIESAERNNINGREHVNAFWTIEDGQPETHAPMDQILTGQEIIDKGINCIILWRAAALSFKERRAVRHKIISDSFTIHLIEPLHTVFERE